MAVWPWTKHSASLSCWPCRSCTGGQITGSILSVRLSARCHAGVELRSPYSWWLQIYPLLAEHGTLRRREKLESWNIIKKDLTSTLQVPEKHNLYHL